MKRIDASELDQRLLEAERHMAPMLEAAVRGEPIRSGFATQLEARLRAATIEATDTASSS